ncbi:LacI family DNA-binding transcriptional regulator [Erysipelotrichaceae bacterium 51-3]
MRKKNSITIAEIAKKAGVSRTTVSFYLNEKFEKMSSKTRQKIQDVIEETEFVPNAMARSLNDKQSHLVGTIVQANENTAKTEFLDGVRSHLQKNGYQMIAAVTSYGLEEERETIEQMSRLNVDGIIINPSESFDLLWSTMKKNIPLVAYNPPHVSRYAAWVRSNDYEVVYTTLEKEASTGYSRFVLVSEEADKCNGIPQRVLAFDHVMRYRHLERKDLYVNDIKNTEDLEFRLLQEIRIDQKTCFFVTTPALLDKVYLILRDYHELIPEHIGLLGFDSQEWVHMVAPSVTTIVQPVFEEGVHAAKLLLDQIEGRNEELPNQIFSCVLQEADTTMKVPD